MEFDDVIVVSLPSPVSTSTPSSTSSPGTCPRVPEWFPEDMDARRQPDEDARSRSSSASRLLPSHLRQELPHAVGVSCDSIECRRKRDGDALVLLAIFVEREGQKGIVVGKRGGQMVKKVGTEARHDIKKLLGCKVFLELRVRVEPQWRRNANIIQRLGYGEQE